MLVRQWGAHLHEQHEVGHNRTSMQALANLATLPQTRQENNCTILYINSPVTSHKTAAGVSCQATPVLQDTSAFNEHVSRQGPTISISVRSWMSGMHLSTARHSALAPLLLLLLVLCCPALQTSPPQLSQ